MNLLNNIKILIIILILVACSNKTEILPDEYLVKAKLNNQYKSTILIEGDKVSKSRFHLNIIPENAGITWKAADNKFSTPEKITKDYNTILISGKPNYVGEIYIDIRWSTYGTNINTGKVFQKRYILKVEE